MSCGVCQYSVEAFVYNSFLQEVTLSYVSLVQPVFEEISNSFGDSRVVTVSENPKLIVDYPLTETQLPSQNGYGEVYLRLKREKNALDTETAQF